MKYLLCALCVFGLLGCEGEMEDASLATAVVHETPRNIRGTVTVQEVTHKGTIYTIAYMFEGGMVLLDKQPTKATGK